jgi:Fe-S cluster assembly protein SufD
MAALETTAQSAESEFASLFAKLRAELPGASWLQPLRAEALARVMRDGLPHRRVEAWKYTDLKNKLTASLTPAAPTKPAAGVFDDLAGHHVVLSGGKIARLPSPDDLPDGLEIMGLAEALAMPSLWLRQWLQPTDQVLDNLNLAFMSDGIAVRVGAGLKVREPLILRTTGTQAGTMANTRIIIALEENAELTLIEIDDGAPAGQSLTNVVMRANIEQGSRLRHLRLTSAEAAAFVGHTDEIDLARDASYAGLVFSSGASLARQQMAARLSGPGADFDIASAYAAGKDEHTDLTVEVTHEAPHTTSRMLAKGVAAAGGHGVVQGRVVVKSEAQKTDSHQLLRGLLLSPHAEIDQKPELEIYADDVKAGHGAAIGALDANQLFYLRARGIPEAEARAMLVAAFLGEVADRVPAPYHEPIAAWLSHRMTKVAP